MRGIFPKLPPKYYEMPSRYKDCFYLANSSFFDSVNWYLHKAYEVVFPQLVDELMSISDLDERQASNKVLNIIEILDQCDNLSDVRFPFKRNNNYSEPIRCFKVKHGSYAGFPSSLIEFVDEQALFMAAGQGAFFSINYFLNNALITSKLEFPTGILGKTFILQGLGGMASNLAVYLQNAGAKCVGVKDYNSHVYMKEGLDIHEVISFKKEKGDLVGFDLAKPEDDFEIYKKDCDILILAARQKSILCHFANKIKAKLIVEAAHHPVTPSAYMTLGGHSKIVLPDLLVCGGSAIAINEKKQVEKNILNSRALGRFEENYSIIPEDLHSVIKDCKMEEKFSTYTIANVISTMAQEMLNTCERYNLGFDFKTAVFIMSIRNIFQEIFTSRKF
ncbi:glutamate dehydrogenase, mitochondrial-like isoform X2 [Harmonia axyridis]|uniref:glutamate dehydrogenase, mitochondrial-like isoform X2 n=1 Tax=Harmonia axyridis TaxID=115357 RepID=UPI001E277FFA|nr:glutamate dehydrogenase, mitochondrial-like isoform X2 [Harmonia axyridis]